MAPFYEGLGEEVAGVEEANKERKRVCVWFCLCAWAAWRRNTVPSVSME